MIPQISDGIESVDTFSYRQPNLTYKLSESQIVGKTTNNLQSIRQSIYHILSTERYSEKIYDDNYGVELEQYIGKDIGTITADIENTLSEALLQDDRITGVSVNNVKKSDKQENSCVIEFTVNTIYGNLEENINVLQ